jgi:hypothetical protein
MAELVLRCQFAEEGGVLRPSGQDTDRSSQRRKVSSFLERFIQNPKGAHEYPRKKQN